jgi:hypothetical protein
MRSTMCPMDAHVNYLICSIYVHAERVKFGLIY